MKKLKKINKGLVLTIIVIITLIIYLTGVEKQRKADKEEIKLVCEKFIEVTDKYSILPEDMQKLNQEITTEQKNAYEKEMNIELRKSMTNSDEAVKLQNSILKFNLKNEYKNNKQQVTTKQKRDIIKIKGYEFDSNIVTVTFSSKLSMEYEYLNNDKQEQIKKQDLPTENDEIQLKKVNGEWKVTYANLQYFSNTGINTLYL